jgi:hypothetical protein
VLLGQRGTAVGYSLNNDGVQVPLAERWDGTTWRIQATPNPIGATKSSLVAVSCATTTTCIAVGSYTNATGHTRRLVERWTGTR